MAETRAEIEILGQRLVVRGEGTPEYIRGLADYLDARVRTAREQARVYDPLRLSLLAGLHVADELFRGREREAALAARVDQLIERLDEALEGARGSSLTGTAGPG
jgi:cell division protein ZapA (FtsZ GTPase activity inhibitor)